MHPSSHTRSGCDATAAAIFAELGTEASFTRKHASQRLVSAVRRQRRRGSYDRAAQTERKAVTLRQHKRREAGGDAVSLVAEGPRVPREEPIRGK